MLMGRTLGWALVYVDWALLSQIFFFFFFFELVNLCIAIIIWIVYLFTNVYKFIVPHSWKLTFLGEKKTLPERKYFVHSFWRERKRHRVVCRARTLCASSPCWYHFILGCNHLWVSKHHKLCEGQNLL